MDIQIYLSILYVKLHIRQRIRPEGLRATSTFCRPWKPVSIPSHELQIFQRTMEEIWSSNLIE